MLKTGPRDDGSLERAVFGSSGQSMNAKFFLPLAVAMLLDGCAFSPKTDVYTYRNDIGGPGIDFIVDNELYSGEKPSELVWLNASRIRQGAWDAQYYLEVR